MVEYIYDVIRVSAGQDADITAIITDDYGEIISEADVSLIIFDDASEIINVKGVFLDGAWDFNVPRQLICGLYGRYWYCINADGNSLCFKKPMYIV